MKRRIRFVGVLLFSSVFLLNTNVKANSLEGLDVPDVEILKTIRGLLPDLDGFGEYMWWPPQDPEYSTRQRTRSRDGGQGGSVGAPLDGGLLALLAGAGIFYFGARNNRRRKE